MATKIEVWREAARLLGDYRMATLTDDSVQRYAFDDSWSRVIIYVLRQSYWKFATKTAVLNDVSIVAVLPGYSYVYDLPCDWQRTHSIFVINTADALECPIDLRHQQEQVHTDIATPYIRYISDDYADPDTWPEHFAYAVACRLAFDNAERITGNPAKTEQMKAKWQEAMQLGALPDTIPESPWYRFQIDGAMLAGCRWLLDEAFWRFAVKTVTLESDRGAEMLVNGGLDTASSWTVGTGWSILSGTARHAAGSAANLRQDVTLIEGVEYEVTFTVSQYVAGTAKLRLNGGTVVDGTVRSGNGTYTETVMASTGNTGFVINASADGNFRVDDISLRQVIAVPTSSSGYEFAFAKPSDFGRLFHMYYASGMTWFDADFRDEGGYFHSAFDALTLRYVSSAGESSLTWSDGFRRSLLSYLEFEEVKRNPASSGAAVQSKGLAWQEAFKNARLKDDLQERPRVFNSGKLTAARQGRSGSSRNLRVYAGGMWG